MRDQLIGYLLGALEPSEHELVEARLGHDKQLQSELAILSRSLQPLAADRGHYEPPLGLAHRTCEFVAVQARLAPAPPVVSVSSRWSMADLAVAAGLFIAASLLFWPAMNQSRYAARLTGCRNNFRGIGVALRDYSELHNGNFPSVPQEGPLAGSGFYAVVLKEKGFIPDDAVVVCPDSDLADQIEPFRIPSSKEFQTAPTARLVILRRQMGGSYGYNLGYIVNGRYHSPQDRSRATFALMADTSDPKAEHKHSTNHGGCGHNVLFEDLHVQYLTTCTARGCRDHIFVNDKGQQQAGLHDRDSVIGRSDAVPFPTPVNTLITAPQK